MQSNNKVSFNYSKVLAYISNVEKEIAMLGNWVTIFEKNETQNQNKIKEMNDYKQKITEKDKSFKENLKNLRFLTDEFSLIGDNKAFSKNMLAWVQEKKKDLVLLKKQLRELQDQKNKKEATPESIKKFQNKLTKKVIETRQQINNATKTICQFFIKNNCFLLEKLTESMKDQLKQKQKKQKKKHENRSNIQNDSSVKL